MEQVDFINAVTLSKTKTELCQKLGMPLNGNSFKKINRRIKELNLDISHFLSTRDLNKLRRKYTSENRNCPVCNESFKAVLNPQKKIQQTCSHKCSNIFIPRGNTLEVSRYRTICFKYHKKECVICGENKIVSVHHFDENHENNVPENLIPLCPTHHQYLHSRFCEEVLPLIKKYRNNFIQFNLNVA
jgi:hypothetical protein